MHQITESKYDSAFCGNLPIHLINMVQSYGGLMVVDRKTLSLIQMSLNLEQVFGKTAAELIGKSLELYLDSRDLHLIRQREALVQKNTTPFPLTLGAVSYLAVLHVKEEYLLIEINFDSAKDPETNSFIDVYQELKSAIGAIESAADLTEAAEITARELKLASGFDKVMIYRFDEEWNGHVLAEEMEPDMESYMNFTFPASDIPRQARELYLKNTYRFIPDRNYQPVKLYPVINPATGTFIDLSDCNVRGVSAVHVEYLKNMGVVASMSTRILKGNQLWGLIACHHKTVKLMSYKMCAIFELLSGIISAKISSLTKNEVLQINSRLKEEYSVILESVYKTGNLEQTLLQNKPGVTELFDAGGAVLVQKGVIHRTGQVPGDHDIEDLLLWLNAKQVNELYYTGSLSGQYDRAGNYQAVASGLLVIPLDEQPGDYLLVFRPEVVKVTNWGGDPSGRINFEADMKTYHPRFSFKLWREQVTGIAIAWKPEEIAIAKNLCDFIREHHSGNPQKTKS